MKAIADNNVKYFARDNNAQAITTRFYDVLNPKKQDTRSAEQVAADVLLRAGITFGERTEE